MSWFQRLPQAFTEWMEISLLVKRSIKNSEVKNGETQLRRLHAACASLMALNSDLWHLKRESDVIASTAGIIDIANKALLIIINAQVVKLSWY